MGFVTGTVEWRRNTTRREIASEGVYNELLAGARVNAHVVL
jgi:hypothetical protein